MSYFIKKKYLVEEKDGKFVPKSFSSVLNVNVAKSDNHKAIKSVDIGTKCKSYFAKSLIINDESLINFYVRVSQYLINNLPFDVKLIKDAQYINPLKRNDPHARTAISNLALEISKVFGDKYASVFSVNSSIDSDQLCEIIRSQFQYYQLEDIPESLYIAESIVEEKQSAQASYWKQAFELCELPYPQTNQKYKRIDVYLYEISKLKNDLGGAKYPQLFILMKSVLSLSHGNVAPESGFSINNSILNVHGSSLKEKTIEALRLVKDYLVKSKGCLNVTITKQMISSVKSAYAKYKLDLEAEKEMKRKHREVQIKEKEKQLNR